jgi:hypothetical protein
MLRFKVFEEVVNGIPTVAVRCDEAERIEFSGGMEVFGHPNNRAVTRAEGVCVRFHRSEQSPTDWIPVRPLEMQTAAAKGSVRFGSFETGVLSG